MGAFDTKSTEGVGSGKKDFSELFKKPKDVGILPLKIAGYGDKYSGKSHFACTALKEPIGYIDTEQGVGLLLQKFKEKDIRVMEFVMAQDADECLERYQQLKEVADWIRKEKPFNTIVVDSISDVYQMIMNALKYSVLEFDPDGKIRLGDIKPSDYSWVENEYKTFLYKLFDSGADVIVLSRVKENWGYGNDGKFQPLGEIKPTWHKNTEYYFDIVFGIDKVYDPESDKNEYVATITKNRLGRADFDDDGETLPKVTNITYPKLLLKLIDNMEESGITPSNFGVEKDKLKEMV
jgi:hypothetical protein